MNAQETIEAGRLMMEYGQAMLDGKPFEVEFKNHVDPETAWRLTHGSPLWSNDVYSYRRKPTPRTVDLGPEDVPPGSVLRHETFTNEWRGIVSVGKRGVYCATLGIYAADCEILEWSELRTEGWLIKRPGDDWKKCEKDEGLP